MTLPLVISLPHCGLEVPGELWDDWAIDRRQVLAEADLGTAEIFAGLPALWVVRARHSRLVANLNRPSHLLDPEKGDGVLPLKTYPQRQSIYQPGREPNPREVGRRLERYYWPYHHELEQALNLPGVRGLLDCHSMDPFCRDGRRRPQICLGDCHGLTCSGPTLLGLKKALAAQGFAVSLQEPYAGGHITRHYGQRLAEQGCFAIQIELNKGLFLEPCLTAVDPARLEEVKQRVARALTEFCAGLGQETA